MTPTRIARSALAAIFTDHDAKAVKEYLAPRYIQHNPAFPDGAEAIISAIPALKANGVSVTTHRVIADGNMIVLHNNYSNADMFGAPELVAFDVFRVEDGKVAEHWDNLQPLVQDTVSGRGMVDGPANVTDLEKTEQNRRLIKAFVTDVLHGQAPEKITAYISGEQYDQHNPLAGDGLDGFAAALEQFAAQGLAMTYDDTPIIVVEGNFAFTASRGKLGDAPTAFFDLFRIEGGWIVEHWDVVSQIPPRSEWKNENGKF